jgi:IS5 family transposase
MHGGTIVDATIIEAPSSTKNSAKNRETEMKPVRKGNQRHFGMKAHIGVDAGTGYGARRWGDGANVHDMEAVPKLIRADDDFVNGDAGYTGTEEREKIQNGGRPSKIGCRINRRKGADKKRRDKLRSNMMAHIEYIAQPERCDVKLDTCLL